MCLQEESRANVVINQKMMKVIVSGIPQSVRLGVAMIEDVITFGRSAEHSSTSMGSPGTFLDFPDAFSECERDDDPELSRLKNVKLLSCSYFLT